MGNQIQIKGMKNNFKIYEIYPGGTNYSLAYLLGFEQCGWYN